MRKLDEKLKIAISRLPEKEKDKLLWRLVLKDQKLIRKLEFELLEGGETRDERAQQLKAEIADNLKESLTLSLTPGLLLLYLRHWNARITEHVQATKDKPGEVALTVFLLAEAFRLHRAMLDSFHAYRSSTLAPYIVKRTKMIMAKAEKLDEDYFIEFRQDLKALLEHIWSFDPTAQLAKTESLPHRWNL
jgi:hypothetical protein